MKALVLSLGCASESGPRSSARNSYHKATMQQLTPSMLTVLKPDAVMAWLFCSDYDICDVARVLSAARYSGQLIAVSDPLPNKAMVCREIKAMFPGLRFDLSFTAKVGDAARDYYETVALEDASGSALEHA